LLNDQLCSWEFENRLPWIAVKDGASGFQWSRILELHKHIHLQVEGSWRRNWAEKGRNRDDVNFLAGRESPGWTGTENLL
jgi:hypothetical protein